MSKITPLQEWKLTYAFIAGNIREAKKAIRSNANWGQFKVPNSQRLLVILKAGATEMMLTREEAWKATDILWHRDQGRRKAKAMIGHNSEAKAA